MNLTAIYELDKDEDFRLRVRTAARINGVISPESWAIENTFELAKRPEFYEKYSDATKTSGIRPGRDTDYITDEMILTAVEEILEVNEPPAEEPF